MVGIPAGGLEIIVFCPLHPIIRIDQFTALILKVFRQIVALLLVLPVFAFYVAFCIVELLIDFVETFREFIR